MKELIGYTDKLSVSAGERIDFMVSTDYPEYEVGIVQLIHGDENPEGPGFKEREIEVPVNKKYPGRKQVAHAGSYVRVEDHEALHGLESCTLLAWIYPTTPKRGTPQGILTKWSAEEANGFGMFIGENGEIGLWLGEGDDVCRGYTGKTLRARHWYFVSAVYDADRGRITLFQLPKKEWPMDESAARVDKAVTKNGVSLDSSMPLLMAAGCGKVVDDHRLAADMLYNGKIDSPAVIGRALQPHELDAIKDGESVLDVAGDDVIGSWDFSKELSTAHVRDCGPHGLDSVAINMPMRAVTAHNWSGREVDYKHAPDQYGAIYFHDDDLEDAHWQVDFTFTIPETLGSGIYAARLRAADQEDHVPFFLRPKRGTTSAPVAFLVPTLTYLAYANERMQTFSQWVGGISGRKLKPDCGDLYLREHPELGLSIYDRHTDGSGVCYSSRRRPVANMRPKYRHWLAGGPVHLPGDLYIVDWLEEKGFAYDVITDEDLHQEGPGLLKDYKVVMTGSHPEYVTSKMLDAIEAYRDGGGKVMYLGGNGFYWVTGVDAERPHMIEVRRGRSGARDWTSEVGECYLSTTGELGGTWRDMGRAPQRYLGIGFTACGWETAVGYELAEGSKDERVEFCFKGMSRDEIIGDFGLLLGGAAGDEIDRIDYELGTPQHTVLIARSTKFTGTMYPTIEDFPRINAELVDRLSTNIHADIIYFEAPNGGAVFATGSICWAASLSHRDYDNNVSKLTENVLREFMK